MTRHVGIYLCVLVDDLKYCQLSETRTSRKGNFPFSSMSIVKWIFGCCLLKKIRNSALPYLHITNMST